MSTRRMLGFALFVLLLAGACIAPFQSIGLQQELRKTLQATAPAMPTMPALQEQGSAAPSVPQLSGRMAPSPDLEARLVQLYQEVSPGVVAIRVYGQETALGAPPQGMDFPTGQGSGFVYDKQGHIVTNYHVIDGGEQFEVVFNDGTKVWADVVGTDRGSDLAVLRVDVPKEKLVPLPVGDSDKVQVGQIVVALGNPFGLQGTMTWGIVSARGRILPSEQMTQTGGAFTMGDLIQTDAAINPGNSGGPLLNLDGEVIGVNRAIRTSGISRGNIGIGFAIASNWVRLIVPSLIEEGEFVYPYLGIEGQDDLPLAVVEKLGLPVPYGVYVVRVVPGSPADKAGLRGAQPTENPHTLPQGGDLIVAIDGHPVKTFDDLISYLVRNVRPGDETTLTIYRDGEKMDIVVRVGRR